MRVANRACACLATALIAGSAPVAVAGPKTLEECRMQAAREARTEAGATAMLADCGRKFAPPKVEPADYPEAECLRLGMDYNPNRWIGPKCAADPPCTDEHKAHNARAKAELAARQKVTKAVCSERGDLWDHKSKLCHKRGVELTNVVACKGGDSQ